MIPPFRSKEEYRAFKAAEKSGKGPKFYPEPDPWTIHLFDY